MEHTIKLVTATTTVLDPVPRHLVHHRLMKKIKSPWYGIAWIVVWTVALVWFLRSGMFDFRESVGLALIWLILVGVTVYLIVQNLRLRSRSRR
ncbi:MAG: hypothetical protein P8182_08140 [Deltaproteobacteria bacterium]